MERRIRVRLIPEIDATFRSAFERACIAAALAGADLDSPDAARIAREHLRASGYTEARIWIFRSVDEYRSRVSNWFVWRDGREFATTVARTALPLATPEARLS